MRTVAAVLALVACVHAGLWASLRTKETAPDFTGQLASISYAPFVNSSHPDSGERPTPEQIRADLKAIAPYTRAIRTYSATGGAELIPPIAAEFGLKVTVGAWIDKRQDRNEREIRSALDLARHNSNVVAIAVGNETMLRDETSAEDLIKLIQRVKRASPVPVTTGENWSAWVEHPELASAVDFIAAHILPYWSGIDGSHAVDHAIEIYDKLRRLHPGKRIVIAEFGWPSAGYNYRDATPGRMEQATIVRDFVARAEAYGIDYNIIEAIDQPWKTAEGGVGPYWGLLDASRQPKFDWTGPLTDPDYLKRAGLAVLLGVLLSLPILTIGGAGVTQALMLAASANLVGAWFAAIVAFWKGHYFVPGAAFALGLGVLLLVPLVAIALARIDEIAAIAFGRPPRRLGVSPPLAPEGYAPKVSIHIPAYREPPEMLKATLDAVARLDYPNLECVVVINNTPDPALWRPVEEHCRTLGERFKFVRVENLTGYKAGALRLALAHTAADAEIIGVHRRRLRRRRRIGSRTWCRCSPIRSVGFVQSPQDHRDGDRSLDASRHERRICRLLRHRHGAAERGQRHHHARHHVPDPPRRASTTPAAGRATPSSRTPISASPCSSTAGHAHYTNRRYGYGLLPDTFEAYKRQRQRWAFGGFQILRKHWRHLLPWSRKPARASRSANIGLGWLNWLGADSVGVVVALLNSSGCRSWRSPISRCRTGFSTLPIIAAFAGFGRALHRTLPLAGARSRSVQMLGAVFAAMSMQWTVAHAVGSGVLKERLPFLRTAKGGSTRKGDFPAFWEAVIAGLLLLGALTLVITNYKGVHEINIFALVLVVQSLPFVSAVAIAAIEGTRFNSFAYWQRVEAKAMELLPRSKTIAEAPKLPAENRVEAAQ